jgi:hypothetical protein
MRLRGNGMSRLEVIRRTVSSKFLERSRETLLELLTKKTNVILTAIEAVLIKDVFDIGLERIKNRVNEEVEWAPNSGIVMTIGKSGNYRPDPQLIKRFRRTDFG